MRCTEYRCFSPVAGEDVVRLSVFDAHGAEFFVIVPEDGGGRRWREARRDALDLIDLAMRQGLPPGEVRSIP